jgi:ketosteroid isomerase-like protein
MLEAGPMDLRLKVVSAEGFGETAIEEGVYKILAPDGQAVDNGKYIVIWKKVDGKWLLHQDIFNSSVPPPGM